MALLLVTSAPLYFARGIGIFDDSLYLKAGQLILDGLQPYRDFYDNKPPGIYYLSAAIAAVGGRGWLAPRIFLFLFAAVFQIAVIRWLQKHFGTRVATLSAIFFGLSYPLAQGYSLHTEPFGAAAAFAACAILLTDAPPLRLWVAAGGLVGLATVFKQTGVLYLAAFGLFALFDVWRQGGGGRIFAARLASLSGGFLATLAPVALAFAGQGLGQQLFESSITDPILRAADAQPTLSSIAGTWMRGPALVAFLGLSLVLATSQRARQAMDERHRRAFVLFTSIGILSTLPTLKLDGVGHYLQPGAFAFSAACAIFLGAYLRSAVGWGRLVTAATITSMAAYFVALCGASADMLRQDKIHADLLLQDQLRRTLDTRLDPNDPVLCVAGGSAARLYLMSGRRPFNRSLYFYPTIDRLFSLDDARRVLFDGRVNGAVVEINPADDRPALTDDEVASLGVLYDIVPLGPQTPLRLLALIRQRAVNGP